MAVAVRVGIGEEVGTGVLVGARVAVDRSEVLVGRTTMTVLVGGMGLGSAVRVLLTAVSTRLISGVDGKVGTQADSRSKAVIKPKILFVMVTLTFG